MEARKQEVRSRKSEIRSRKYEEGCLKINVEIYGRNCLQFIAHSTPEGIRGSANFEKNKGYLPWPVDKGFIKTHFGLNRIEGMPIIFDNPGLTIQTEPGAAVKAVFEGDVLSVFDIEGKWAVMIQHGKYYTTYSNLTTVNVSKNDKIVAGQVLGTAAVNADGTGEIDFLLMQERNKVDPEKWIRGK